MGLFFNVDKNDKDEESIVMPLNIRGSNKYYKPLEELVVNGENQEEDDGLDDDNFDVNNEENQDAPAPTEDEQDDAQVGNTNDELLDSPPQEDNVPEEGDDNFDIDDQPENDDNTGGEDAAPNPEDNTDNQPPDDNVNSPTEDDINQSNDTQQLANNDTATEDIEDDFTLGDDDGTDTGNTELNQDDIGTGDGNARGTDDATVDDGDNRPENPEETGGTGDNTDSGDNFDIDAGDDTGEEGMEGTDDGMGTGDQTDTSSVSGAQGDPSDQVSDEQQKENEKRLYDTLTEEQKQLRVLQLKKSYRQLYDQSENILSSINGITKTQDNIDTLRRVIEALEKIKKLLLQYISTNYDMNTYIENYTNYIKFLATFRTISKVMNELSLDDDKK